MPLCRESAFVLQSSTQLSQYNSLNPVKTVFLQQVWDPRGA
jgi:hypothetical protein